MAGGTGWDELLRGTVQSALKSVVETTFHRCGTEGCTRRSPGEWAVCHACSRRCCLTHGFLTLEAPPQVICSTCVVVETGPARARRGGGQGAGGG